MAACPLKTSFQSVSLELSCHLHVVTEDYHSGYWPCRLRSETETVEIWRILCHSIFHDISKHCNALTFRCRAAQEEICNRQHSITSQKMWIFNDTSTRTSCHVGSLFHTEVVRTILYSLPNEVALILSIVVVWESFSSWCWLAGILMAVLCLKGHAPVHQATWVSCVNGSASQDGLDWSAASCVTAMMTTALSVTLWLGHVCVSQIGVGCSVRHAVHRDTMGRTAAVSVSVRTTVHVTQWQECVPVHVAGRVKTATPHVKRVTMGLAARRSVLTWYMVRKHK